MIAENSEFLSLICTLFVERAERTLPNWRMEDQLLLYHTTDGFQSSKINIFERHFKCKLVISIMINLYRLNLLFRSPISLVNFFFNRINSKDTHFSYLFSFNQKNKIKPDLFARFMCFSSLFEFFD